MPIQYCSDKGKSGKKYGQSGKCYTGGSAMVKAVEQMKAIKASEARSGKMEK